MDWGKIAVSGGRGLHERSVSGFQRKERKGFDAKGTQRLCALSVNILCELCVKNNRPQKSRQFCLKKPRSDGSGDTRPSRRSVSVLATGGRVVL